MAHDMRMILFLLLALALSGVSAINAWAVGEGRCGPFQETFFEGPLQTLEG